MPVMASVVSLLLVVRCSAFDASASHIVAAIFGVQADSDLDVPDLLQQCIVVNQRM